MNRHLLFFSVALCCCLFSCKKENNTVNTPISGDPLFQEFGASPIIPPGAAGIFYSVRSITTNAQSTSKDTLGAAFAWLGDSTNTINGGAITCNGNTLTIATSNGFSWYQSGNPEVATSIPFHKDSSVWSVSGNGSVPAINYVDKVAFPVVDSIYLFSDIYSNTSVSLDSNISVEYRLTGTFNEVFLTITGSKGSFTQNVTGETTITLPPTTVGQVAVASGDILTVQITPIDIYPIPFSGKTYYFAKQTVYQRSVATALKPK